MSLSHVHISGARNQGRAARVTLTGEEPAIYRIGALSPDEEHIMLVYSEGKKGNKKAKKKACLLYTSPSPRDS